MKKILTIVILVFASTNCQPDVVYSKSGGVKFSVEGKFVPSGNIFMTIDGKTTTINKTIAEDIVRASGMMFGYPCFGDINMSIEIEN